MSIRGLRGRVGTDTNETKDVTVSESGSKVAIDVNVVGGASGGGGDASAANQALQILESEETNTKLEQLRIILEAIETNTANSGGSVSEINDLIDVDTNTVTASNGDVLQWDGTNWVPVTPVAADTDKLVGGNGSVVTSNADMDGTSNQNTSGYFQVQDTNGEGQLQMGGDSLTLGPGIERLAEGYGLVLDVGRNWLFNSVTNLSQRFVKVTMQDSDPTKTVDLFTGQNIGFVTTIYFGEHPNHQAAFTVDSPGSIVGHPSGIVMDTPGQAIRLRQTGTSEWAVEASTFDLFSTGGGASELDDLTDVDTTTTAPSNGDTLVYDGTNFVPQAPSGGTSTEPVNRIVAFNDHQDGDTVVSLTGLTVGDVYLVTTEFLAQDIGNSATANSYTYTNANFNGSVSYGTNNDGQRIHSTVIIIPTATTVNLNVFGTGGGLFSVEVDLKIVKLNNAAQGTGF